MIFVYNLVADRLTPYSSHATVQAYIVGIAPEVAGNAVEVAVIDNQVVNGGDLLFRIDPQPYEVAVREAEAAVDRAGQTVGASTAGVDGRRSGGGGRPGPARERRGAGEQDVPARRARRLRRGAGRPDTTPARGRASRGASSRSPARAGTARARPTGPGKPGAQDSPGRARAGAAQSRRHHGGGARPWAGDQPEARQRPIHCRWPPGDDLHRPGGGLDLGQLPRKQLRPDEVGSSGRDRARRAAW